MMIYHRSFRYYAGRDKVWKPFSFVGQDHYYVWPNELKVLPRTCASTYPYEEDGNVKENIKKTNIAGKLINANENQKYIQDSIL